MPGRLDSNPGVAPNVNLHANASQLIASVERGGRELIDQLAEEWRDLCAEGADDQPFFRPEFIRAHIRAVISGAKVMIVTVRRDGHLRFLLPLVEELGTFSRMPVRKLRAPVNFNCGRFDAVRSAGPEGDAAISTAWGYLKNLEGWDLLQLRDTLEGSAVGRMVELARADGFRAIQLQDRPNPYVPIPADSELLKKLPRNARLRTQLRQVRRLAAEQGSLKFYRVATADRDALDRLLALEASGWKGRKGSAVNCKPWALQFFNELAEVAARFGYLSLYMLEFNGELIAAHFCLTYQGRCYSPIVAHNENFRQFAPGHLIVSEILQDCAARGIRGYDITGQDQEWKMKWTDQALPVYHHYVFKGAIGKLAHTVGSRLRPALGQLLRGRKRAS